ncbi:hypothetical protein KTS45_13535 [Halomicroarcula limicola]|uniref:dolichyl-phosphooligosaccharide-protein glycotransferase n=1 Tax=Haloarcula limicola TaxID=1429915 RepID=A0A8J7Y709_9EURY|nr:STT3 domain-containing protein [Halomicroarcula limicola]MBV0925222.1 hypothetical protein [Halomicroarcula limicola]
MSDDGGAVTVLEDRPELAAATEDILAVDAERETWTFDDVPVDSGMFGELVSSGIVEKADDGNYRVANPNTVRASLGDEPAADESSSLETPDFSNAFENIAIEPRAIAMLAGALAVLLAARAYVIGAIYRGGDIVLSGNDPYYYRYWVEQIAAEAGGRLDFASLAVLPDAVTKGEPLMVATLWWVAELLGGGDRIIGHVLAWYPVLSALVSGVLVYLLAVRVTNDRRVGLASVLFLAFLPGHAFRTSLGFADHHAFDYPWLGLTALALLVVLTVGRDEERAWISQPTTWIAAGGLGLGIAGQVLSWEAGPLLIVPVGLAVAAATVLDLYVGRTPSLRYVPVLLGVGLGALLTWGVHAVAGWHTTLVASAPILLFIGVAGVVLLAVLVDRIGGTATQLVAVDAVVGIGGLLLVRSVFSEQWAEFVGRLDTLFRSDAIAEVYGLFSTESFGFLFLLGFTLILALPVMVWCVRLAATDNPGWAVLGTYAWYFLVLATIQVRFVGELGTFISIFAGYAFVALAAHIDLARPTARTSESVRSVTIPDRKTIGLLFALFLLVGSFGALQVPIKTSQIVIDDGTYETATALDANAAAHELEYPKNYVFSRWGQNRVYNYFVSGESRSYAYAQNNYADFATSTNPEEWYDRLSGRAGYVVVQSDTPVNASRAIHTRLYESYGSRTEQAPGVAHYRPVFATADGRYKAFALVPGGTIEGTAAPNATVTASTTLSVSNQTVEYQRQTTAGSDGAFSVTVANPGTYTVTTGNKTREVVVSEEAVTEGGNVSVSNGTV